MTEQGYKIVGHGSDLAIDVRGPDLASCVHAAVAGFAASLAEVGDDAPRQDRTVTVTGDEPVDLLVELFGELITIVDVEGAVPVGAASLRAAEGRWELDLHVVPLAALDVHGVAPKAATWHRTRLEPTQGGWEGRVTLDL